MKTHNSVNACIFLKNHIIVMPRPHSNKSSQKSEKKLLLLIFCFPSKRYKYRIHISRHSYYQTLSASVFSKFRSFQLHDEMSFVCHLIFVSFVGVSFCVGDENTY